MTARAIGIGLFCAVMINLVMLYSDYYVDNTPLILNHFPTAGMAVLMLLIVINAVWRRWGSPSRFSQGELLLIWSMIGVAGGIGATGFGRAVPGFAAGPAYFATGTNGYEVYLLAHLPDWMVVSKDPASKAVQWYFEGLPRDQSIPWGAWVVPMAAWAAFAGCLYCVMFAFSSMFLQQWSERERLTFPIIYLPLEMTREAPPGRLFNDFLRNPAVWMGAAIPILLYAVNGLKTYFPAIPEIPTQWGTWNWFADRPWNQFNLGWAYVYFSIIGLTFLLTTEVSFSLWFFYFLHRLSYVFVAWIGAGGTGFFGNWRTNVIVFEAAGAVLVLAGFLFWSARRSLGAWLQRVRSGADDAAADLLPARLTLFLLIVGFGGMLGWVMLGGASWWAALLGILLFVCVVLVLTRLVVEAGLLLVGTEAIAYEFVSGLVPPAWVSGPTLTTFVSLRGGLMSDLREILMPYVLHGVRACSMARLNGRKIMAVFAVTVVVALLAASFGRIATGYKYGAIHGDTAYNLGWQSWLYPHAVKYQVSPPSYPFVQAGEVKVVPVTVAHVGVGAGLTAAMLLLRAKFLWWPLNPIGFIVCGSWAISVIWFSLLLGWMAKASIMTFGGATAYRRALPFFLGLVLGEAVIATTWIGVSLMTGSPGVYMLPH